MNVFTPFLLDAGAGVLSLDEGRKYAAHLGRPFPPVPGARRDSVMKEIRGATAIAQPETAFEDLYTPDWYVPGWKR